MLPIKAIPTRYAGVNFRSRLEARWAAFFDLNRWSWDYEPCDFDGWCPDFRLRTPTCHVFVEIKPLEMDVNSEDVDAWHQYDKAFQHWKTMQVMLLGDGPVHSRWPGIGTLLDPPPGAGYYWADVHKWLYSRHKQKLWREAGNRVQWNPDLN